MLQLNIYQNNDKESKAYGKYYPSVDQKESYTIDMLAEHMASHHTPFSKGTIKGVLEDMVGCIREIALDGNTVKIDNLAIFKCSVEGRGKRNLTDMSLQEGGSVKNVKLLAISTGNFTRAELNKSATLGWTKQAQRLINDAKAEAEEPQEP